MSSTRAGGAEQDGGAVFPRTETYSDDILGNSSKVRTVGGMSLRDYFAAKALSGLLAQGTQGTFSNEVGVALAADYAYEYADAMLRARSASPAPAPSPSEPLSPAETMRAHIDTFGEKP